MIPSGRGAAIQRILAERREEQAREDELRGAQRPMGMGPVGMGPVGPSETRLTEEVAIAMKEVAIARPGRGRGLQSIPPVPSQTPMGRGVGYYDSLQERPGRSVESPSPPEPSVGRGRSALLAAFIAQQRVEDTAPGKSSVETLTAQSKPVPSVPTPSVSSRSPPQPEFSRGGSSKFTSEAEEKPPVIQRGCQGEPQDVVCNYINLDVEPGKGVFEYDLKFSPPEDNISMRNRMINQHLDQIGGAKSYNGVKLFLSVDLKYERSFKCEHPVQGTLVDMTLACKGPAKARDAADIYNNLFRRIMVNLGLKNMGRKFFDPSGAVNIPRHRLEVWPGYVTAVQQFEGGIQLCCDASHRVMRTDSVLQVMTSIIQMGRDKYREEILKVVLGAIVLTRYNNRVYRVDDIDWDQNPMSSFPDQSGREISFVEYYKSQHGIVIQDQRQPLLISRIDRKEKKETPKEIRMICLIPELCYITGLTDAIRNDFNIMKDLTQKLQLTPTQRYDGLCKFLQNVECNKSSQDLLQKWGLHVSRLPIRLEARTLPPETILFGNGKCLELSRENSNWVVNHTLLTPKDIQRWAILFVKQDKATADRFENEMRSSCAQMGMRVSRANMVQIPENRNDVFLNTLRSTIEPALQLVVVFFSSLRSDRYAAVKKVCCIEKPVSSQVIQARTLSRPDKMRSIVKKIAMQINCKLGGALWGVKIPFVKEKLMVCGMDVYHGPAGKHTSVMGFVATSDPLQTTWYSRVGFGSSNQEISENLRICMLGSLKKYFEVSGVFPDRIIMYRDGVSDGQLRMTQEFEIPQMMQSFKDLKPSYKPSLTVVVCQKRIMTRVLAVKGGNGSNLRLANPGPGTVVDHTVTRHDWYDFFLVSQSSNRGTISPTHYIVVYDDGLIKPDHIQRMTYKMTHLYYNWTGTISIPAPAQYAHRLAQLVGQHLHKDVSGVMCDKLYFL